MLLPILEETSHRLGHYSDQRHNEEQQDWTKLQRSNRSFGLFYLVGEDRQGCSSPLVFDKLRHDVCEIAFDSDILIQQAVNQTLIAIYIAGP